MSGDLVSRLRRAVTWRGDVPYGNELAREAAAEIERLKSDRDYWRRVADERLRRLDDLSGNVSALSAEIERLRALAIRAWHSFRSGLSATGGCRDGLTDADILELVKLSNVEVAKLRGHDSVAATIAEAERQAKIPKMPGEREDEPIE